jgi:signal transduction histidine kinase
MATLEAFAAQAAVAIETARAQRQLVERNEALKNGLDRETATADILTIISQSPGDIERVLAAIGDASRRLCEADLVFIGFKVGDQPWHYWDHRRGYRRHSPADSDGLDARIEELKQKGYDTFAGPIDESADARYPYFRVDGLSEGALLRVPMLGTTEVLGVIMVRRNTARAFAHEHVSLLQRFAAQAVIAIDNARVFNELQARNHEITEALRREEASSNILRQISNAPEQLEQTLQAIAETARSLTGMSASVWLNEGEAPVYRSSAMIAGDPMIETPIGTVLPTHDGLKRTMATGQPVVERQDSPSISPQRREEMRLSNIQTSALVPITRGDAVLGVIGVANFTGAEVTPAIVTLLQSFADQAAIAIENARLIRELRESNQVVRENLDRQQVLGNVLSIIASAPADLDATLPQIAAAAKRLCEADQVTVTCIDGKTARSWDEFRGGNVYAADDDGLIRRGVFSSAAINENRVVEVVGPIDEWAHQYPRAAETNRRLGRTELAALAVPMPSRDGPIGAIMLIRNGTRRFTARNRAVLEALANQAVIAIDNARLFNQLQAKTQELEIASRHKSEFLANMSHELRTPLNAIIGYAELLKEECEDLGQEEFLPDLGKIHTAGKHLLNLISGILDLSKVEAGRMTMFLEDFDVATLVSEAESIVRPVVEKNRNTFVIDCPADIGVMRADLVKVRQVLFNLLSNAAKFTEGGTITLIVRRHADAATYTFAIRDTGIGITDAQLARLFEAFSQAEAHTSRKYGGTGLGLALSRQFCLMMGGDITVDSIPGEGSTFTVALPVRCADPGAGGLAA